VGLIEAWYGDRAIGGNIYEELACNFDVRADIGQTVNAFADERSSLVLNGEVGKRFLTGGATYSFNGQVSALKDNRLTGDLSDWCDHGGLLIGPRIQGTIR
jgi:hypothetical protein